jgi:hypothetical protein
LIPMKKHYRYKVQFKGCANSTKEQVVKSLDGLDDPFCDDCLYGKLQSVHKRGSDLFAYISTESEQIANKLNGKVYHGLP